MILSWSKLTWGGFQPPEVRPQLRKFCEPLGCWSLAPLEPQPLVSKPKRPAPEAEDDDDDEEEEEAEDELELELDLELELLLLEEEA